MTRPMLAAVTLVAILRSTQLFAVSSEQPEANPVRELRNEMCANCLPRDDNGSLSASRMERSKRIATRLSAPSACADPGVTGWFVEEEAHLTAFVNSHSTPRYK